MRPFGSPAFLIGWVRPAAFRPYLTARLALSGTSPGDRLLAYTNDLLAVWKLPSVPKVKLPWPEARWHPWRGSVRDR